MVLSLSLPGPDAESALMIVGLGAVAFFVGLGLVLNGSVFTRPRKGLEDLSAEARSQNLLDADYASPQLKAGEAPPSFRSQTTSNLNQAGGTSVTEGTTHHLSSKR
jgi:hypothetical protein